MASPATNRSNPIPFFPSPEEDRSERRLETQKPSVDERIQKVFREELNSSPLIHSMHHRLLTCIRQNRPKEALFIIDKLENLNIRDKDGWTLLHYAARYGQGGVFRILLERGLEIDAVDKMGWTPLHVACRNRQHEIVLALVEEGADINAVIKGGSESVNMFKASLESMPVTYTYKGWTPLLLACEFGPQKTIESLLAKGADVNKASAKKKYTPLHRAIWNFPEGIVRQLLDKGADVNAVTSLGETPLHYAVGKPTLNQRIVDLLLDRGAKNTIRSSNGEIPSKFAKRIGRKEIARMIVRHGQ